MKRSTKAVALAIVCLALAVSVATAFAENPPAAPYTQKDLNEQTVMALAWMQSAAEYRELFYQGYALASMIVDKAVTAAKAGDKPLAIISDLDETLLDNTAYDAGFIGSDSAFSGKTWTQWEKAALAKAMPGAAEFLNAVAKRKVEIFYVTNRDQAGLEGTIKNLAALGFPFADAKHVLVSTTTSDKQPRFDAVAKDYKVVLYMGDNESDLPIGAWHKGLKERNALVDQNADKFGSEFVAFPNPLYGDWESALAPGYFGLTAEARSDARKAVLRTWTAQ